MAVELVDPRHALEVVPRDLRLPCCGRWRIPVVVVVGVGLFSAYIQALHGRDLPEEGIRVLNKIIPGYCIDLQGLGEAFEDMEQMGLSGEKPLGEAKTKAPSSDYQKNEPSVAAGGRRSRGTTSSAQQGPMSSALAHRAPTGPWSSRLRGTTGPGSRSS